MKLLFKQILGEIIPVIEGVFNDRKLILEGQNFLVTKDTFQNQICLYCKVSRDQRFWGSHEDRMLISATHLVFISYIDRLLFVVDKYILESFIQSQSVQTMRSGRPLDPNQYKYSLEVDDNKYFLVFRGISKRMLVNVCNF